MVADAERSETFDLGSRRRRALLASDLMIIVLMTNS
jgi:hypothetical protein